jgi:hypothetical protein
VSLKELLTNPAYAEKDVPLWQVKQAMFRTAATSGMDTSCNTTRTCITNRVARSKSCLKWKGGVNDFENLLMAQMRAGSWSHAAGRTCDSKWSSKARKKVSFSYNALVYYV